MERWPSGRRRWTGIPVTSSRVFVGSNPTLSAIRSMVIRAGSFATTYREPRQARKGAAAADRSGAEVQAGADHLPLPRKSIEIE